MLTGNPNRRAAAWTHAYSQSVGQSGASRASPWARGPDAREPPPSPSQPPSRLTSQTRLPHGCRSKEYRYSCRGPDLTGNAPPVLPLSSPQAEGTYCRPRPPHGLYRCMGAGQGALDHISQIWSLMSDTLCLRSSQVVLEFPDGPFAVALVCPIELTRANTERMLLRGIKSTCVPTQLQQMVDTVVDEFNPVDDQ